MTYTVSSGTLNSSIPYHTLRAIFFVIFGMFRVGVTFGTLVTFGTVTTVKLFNALSIIPGEFRYIL